MRAAGEHHVERVPIVPGTAPGVNDKLVIRGSTGMERLEIVRQRTMVEEDVFGKRR